MKDEETHESLTVTKNQTVYRYRSAFTVEVAGTLSAPNAQYLQNRAKIDQAIARKKYRWLKD